MEDVKSIQRILANRALTVKFLESVSMAMRALDGKPIEEHDIISRLTNIKNILERSRFPTYPIIQRQVYLRLGHAIFGKDAEALKIWADLEAEALISYKGKSREENVEMAKHQAAQESQQIIFGRPMQQAPKKSRWPWGRKEQPSESEFVHQ